MVIGSDGGVGDVVADDNTLEELAVTRRRREECQWYLRRRPIGEGTQGEGEKKIWKKEKKGRWPRLLLGAVEKRR